MVNSYEMNPNIASERSAIQTLSKKRHNCYGILQEMSLFIFYEVNNRTKSNC